MTGVVLALGCAEPTPGPSGDTQPPALAVGGGVLETPDGNRIVYDARGSGETALVFVHCWACNRAFWKEQLDAFAQDYRVVAMDLPGHGDSSAQREAWTLSALADDVRALIEELDLQRVILVGHSMGGPVVALAAPRMPERVLGVACVDTLHDASLAWDEEAIAPIVEMYEGGFSEANRQFVPMMFPEGADPAIVDWVVESANGTNPEAALGLMADFPSLDLRRLLSEVGVPVRCVNAAPLGRMIPPTAIETNRELADFDAVTIEGVGHYLMLEKPAEFNRALAEALAEMERPAS